MNIKRITSLLLIAVMTLTLSSCGFIIVEEIEGIPTYNTADIRDDLPDAARAGSPYFPADSDSDARRLAEERISAIGEYDYGGRIVFVAESVDIPIFADESDTVVGRLKTVRDALVENTLNVKLVKKMYSSAELFERAKLEKASGEQTDDVYVIQSEHMAKFAAEGVLTNLSALDANLADYDFIDYSLSSLSSLTGEVYGISGDASNMPADFTVVYMNKTVLGDAGVSCGEIYSSVLDGGWTFERLINAADGINGIGIITPNSKDTLFDLIYSITGGTYLRAGALPTAVYTREDVREAGKAFSALMQMGVETSDYSAAANFAEGKAPFMIHRLAALEKVAASGVDFGILPLPTVEAGGEYRTLMQRQTEFMAIPKESGEKSAGAAVILAANAATADIVYGGYTRSVFTEYLRDSASADMLDIIFTTAVGEPAFTLGAEYPTVAAATYSFAYKYRDADDKTYDKQYKTATEAMNKALAKVKKEIDKKK